MAKSPFRGIKSRLMSRHERNAPEVSIVIPVYNVEGYIGECLDSILAQTFTDFEIIAVDDGSTDGTPAILADYAGRDPRVRVIRQDNAGPAAALNTGVRNGRGAFLTFSGSDDLLPPKAFEIHLTALNKSGSDFSIGAVMRLRGQEQRPARWVAQTNAEDDLGVTVDDRPDLIVHAIPCSKMFRTSFWRDNDLEFSEGMLYEDQVPSMKAFLTAASIDVLAATVFLWRVRDSGDSITQSVASMRNIEDTVWVSKAVNELLLKDARPHLRRRWLDERILNHSIPLFADEIDDADQPFYAQVVEWVDSLFTTADWEATSEAPILKRLLAWFLVHGTRQQVAEIRMWERTHGSHTPTVIRDGAAYAEPDLECLQTTDVPAGLLRLSDRQTAATASLSRLTWTDSQQLSLIGGAYIRAIDLANRDTTILVLLTNERTGSTREISTTPYAGLELSRRASNRFAQIDRGGFEAELDLDELYESAASRDGEGLIESWRLSVRVNTGGLTRDAPLTRPYAPGGAWMPLPGPVADDLLIQPEWVAEGFRLTVHRPAVVCESAVEGDETMILTGRAPIGAAGTVLLDRDRAAGFTVDDSGHFHAEVPFSALAAKRDTARNVRIDVGNGAKALQCAASVFGAPSVRRSFTIRASGRGRLVVGFPEVSLHIHGVDLTSGELNIDGVATGMRLEQLTLESSQNPIRADRLDVSADGAFVAHFSLTLSEWGGPRLPIPPASYRLTGSGNLLDGASVDADSRVSDPIFARMPMDCVGLLGAGIEPATYRLWIDSRRTLVLDAVRQLGEAEGPAAQVQVQREVYRPAIARDSIRHAVLFESNRGRHVTCNPAAIWRELASRDSDLKAYWSVNDRSVAVPAGTTPLVRESREWYEILASAKYLVSNNHFPSYFTKSSGQVHLQTWHGTPLKRIGYDTPRTVFSNRVYFATLDREVPGWDHLIVPNAFSADVFPGAFGYSGELLETGYPRNDVLTTGPAAGADRARSVLGLTPGQKVLLYAPTWRDDKNNGNDLHFSSVDYLDTERFVGVFGDEYVILVRGHNNTLLHGERTSGRSVLDVTGYPEVADLYALADVMITDYSSVMFDYAVTGKPMLFLVPDLADYRDRVRGFYFDFEAQAPGPLANSTDEIIDAITNLSRTIEQFEPRYAAFQKKFTCWEDGGASKRVVDAVFSARGDG